MTGSEAATIIRMRVADTDSLNLTDNHILENINTAIRFLSQILINKKDPIMTAEENVVDFTQMPARFHSFVGKQPCYIEGAVIRSFFGAKPIHIRYWRTKEGLSALKEDIPFPIDYCDSIIEGAIMLCLNKDEFDVSFEDNFFNRINSCLPGEGTTVTSSSSSSENT